MHHSHWCVQSRGSCKSVDLDSGPTRRSTWCQHHSRARNHSTNQIFKSIQIPLMLCIQLIVLNFCFEIYTLLGFLVIGVLECQSYLLHASLKSIIHLCLFRIRGQILLKNQNGVQPFTDWQKKANQTNFKFNYLLIWVIVSLCISALISCYLVSISSRTIIRYNLKGLFYHY